MAATNHDKPLPRVPVFGDDELLEILAHHTKPGRKFCKPTVQPTIRLEGSVTEIVDRVEKFNDYYSQRQWYRRMGFAHAKLGVGLAKKDIDMCPACACWGTVTSKEVKAQVAEVVGSLEALDPLYFEEFEDECERRGGTIPAA